MEYKMAVVYAGGLFIFNAFNTILLNQLQITAFHVGMKVRVALSSLIYRKVRHFLFETKFLQTNSSY